MKRLLFAFTISATLSLAAMSAAANERHSGERSMKAHLAQLDLSMTQKMQIRRQLRDTRGELSVYREDFRKLLQDGNSLMASGNLQPSALSALLDQYQPTIKNMVKSRAKVKHIIWQILDSEQRANAEKLKQEKIANFSADKFESRLTTRLESMALTEAQQQPVMAALEELARRREKMRQQMADFLQQQQSIIHASEFDETQWQVVFDVHFPQFLSLASDMVAGRQSLRQLLTPEQQEKLPANKGMKFLRRMLQS